MSSRPDTEQSKEPTTLLLSPAEAVHAADGQAQDTDRDCADSSSAATLLQPINELFGAGCRQSKLVGCRSLRSDKSPFLFRVCFTLCESLHTQNRVQRDGLCDCSLRPYNLLQSCHPCCL
ncbi:hypothetical protein BLNAU_2902 [Blattamonas nauphoetae]|uniref:Uncharacterized protein n=1 Tax=Blattamonas nauphoetae TaxID=2049346 RepID=A0ABQ9YES2_9EUKA|nr:hypothetical protein BLNAU_2902 [Blattamonas nauphoetae]